ncbi:uncharacterized protein LOC134834456 isoform X2 [Culicoides brevitarsis]|uniref:uncharacterized protein LOC134834456 isoform X2 n=1 Tax=Culicoides brevitarsis TaxID=469753 RepID=UPI00307B93BB
MIINSRHSMHLLLLLIAFTMCHAKPQFLISRFDETAREKFYDDVSDSAQEESNDISENHKNNHILPQISFPLRPLNVTTDIKGEFGVQKARNRTIHSFLKLPFANLATPLMKPEQVEIISRDKMELGPNVQTENDVVVIKPKAAITERSSPRVFRFPDTDRIIFPSDFENIANGYQEFPGRQPEVQQQPTMDVRFSESRFVPRGCRDGSVVCSTKDDYPTDHINKVVAKNRARLVEFFGDDIVPQVVQRVDYPDEETLCHSRELVLYPTMGQTKDNKWAYIINNGNFSQGVRVEQCINENRPCAYTESFPYGYTTECKQKFIYRHLLALDENGDTVKNLFRLPACCKCIVRSSYGGNIFSRHASLKRGVTNHPDVEMETTETTTKTATTTTKTE